MKSIKLLTLLASLGMAMAAQAQIKWSGSYATSLDEAKKTGKVMMVEFYVTWDDEWCAKIDNETFSDPSVIIASKKVIPVRLDAEKNGAALMKKYHVTNFPTVLFLDKNERLVGIIDGFEEASEFTKHSATFLKEVTAEPGLVARHKAAPKDLDAIAGLGTMYADRYQIDPALAMLKAGEAVDKAGKSPKLSGLYNAIGDYYQYGSKFESAIVYFTRGSKNAGDTDTKAYSYLSVATCLISQTPPKAKQAIAPLEAALKLPRLKPEDKQIASNLLEIAHRLISAGG